MLDGNKDGFARERLWFGRRLVVVRERDMREPSSKVLNGASSTRAFGRAPRGPIFLPRFKDLPSDNQREISLEDGRDRS